MPCSIFQWILWRSYCNAVAEVPWGMLIRIFARRMTTSFCIDCSAAAADLVCVACAQRVQEIRADKSAKCTNEGSSSDARCHLTRHKISRGSVTRKGREAATSQLRSTA